MKTLRLLVVQVPTRFGSGVRVDWEDDAEDAAAAAGGAFWAFARETRERLQVRRVDFMLVMKLVVRMKVSLGFG